MILIDILVRDLLVKLYGPVNVHIPQQHIDQKKYQPIVNCGETIPNFF